jgi:hypothetical protein
MEDQRRRLTRTETSVLRDVRAFWGPQNTDADVFIADRDEAVLFVKEKDGSSRLIVVLTNLAEWREDGTLSTWEYRRQIMGPVADGHSSIWLRGAYYAARLRARILDWESDA